MKLLLRVQRDLFALPAQPPELISSDRQKAVSLLQALLMEAVMDLASVPSSGAETEAGNE
jgi:hypothetical protein